MRKKRHIWFALFLCTTMMSCNEIDLVQGLQERDANEILVVLDQHNIQATKEKVEQNQEVTWVIKVDNGQEQLARSVLVANNLPRVRLGGLKGICQEAGMILTRKTEKCRELLAVKEEVINLLESVACVVSADVVLNIPEKEEFPIKDSVPAHPTATATVKYLKNCASGVLLSEQRVQDIVANAVSNLDPRDVTVVISYLDAGFPMLPVASDAVAAGETKVDCPAPATQNMGEGGAAPVLVSIAGFSMDEGSSQKFKMVSLIFLVLFLLVTSALILMLFRLSRVRKTQIETSKALANPNDS